MRLNLIVKENCANLIVVATYDTVVYVQCNSVAQLLGVRRCGLYVYRNSSHVFASCL